MISPPNHPKVENVSQSTEKQSVYFHSNILYLSPALVWHYRLLGRTNSAAVNSDGCGVQSLVQIEHKHRNEMVVASFFPILSFSCPNTHKYTHTEHKLFSLVDRTQAQTYCSGLKACASIFLCSV